jgi:acylphosphatase
MLASFSIRLCAKNRVNHFRLKKLNVHGERTVDNQRHKQIIGTRFCMVARQFLISGMVQGVGYRFFVLRAAARHQVLGTVRNLPDGRVEVVAEGERDAIDEFKKDLATGPAMAAVTDIDEIDLPVTGRYRDFHIDH